VNAANTFQKTPVMYAASSGHLNVVKYLVEAWGDVDARDSTEKTAFVYATQKGHLDVVNFLLQQGAIGM